MDIKTWLKKLRLSIRIKREKKYFFAQQKNTFELSALDIKKSNQMGFTADEYVIYDLIHNNPKEYISEFERNLFREKVRDYRILLDNKLVFYHIIKNFASINTVYAYKQSELYITLVSGFEQFNIITKLQTIKKLVYKKIYDGGGRGFKLLEYQENTFWVNHCKASPNAIIDLLNEDNYLIEQFCEQGSFENSIWPYSVNTIRVVSLLEVNEIIIGTTIQRIGIDKEKCVDNACAGGLYAMIDIDTGIMSAARSHSKENLFDENGQIKLFKNHPVTGSMIQGVKIPNWSQTINDIKELHKKLLFTNIPFIAWDIALLDEGFKIIEANTSCSMDLLQAFGGVRNLKIGQWMKCHNYID